MASNFDSTLSSPDPLGHSLTENTPKSTVKKPAQNPTTPRKALIESHGNTQVHHLYLTTPPTRKQSSSSPTKSSAKSQCVTSPWRIRVTVEAEPENTMADSPSKRLVEKTITTTVPLKGATDSNSPAAKRGRGRPRKSLDGPVKRNGTPKPKATGRRKTTDNGNEELSEKERSGMVVSPKKPRGRPRRSIGSSPAIAGSENMNAQQTSKALSNNHSEELPGSQGHTKVGTSRKRTASDCGNPPTSANDESGATESMHFSTRPKSASLKGRPAKRRSLEKPNDAGDSNLPNEPEILTNDTSPHDLYDQSAQDLALAKADEDMWRSMIHQDTLPPADDTGGEGNSINETQEDEEMTGNDPTDKHQEFDSILESEGFSMVSVSSLPSAQQQPGNRTPQTDNHMLGSAINTSPAQVSNVVQATSPNQTSPPILSSTSSMPPPPIPSTRFRDSPEPIAKPTDGTPKFGRVVRAGIALQGALSPVNSSSQTNPPVIESDSSVPFKSTKSSKEKMDKLFDGFGAGTRRELRAGLRLGEELAKRQQSTQGEMPFKERNEDDVFSQDTHPGYPRLPTSTVSGYSLKIPGVEQGIHYPALLNPQLPSPAGSSVKDEDEMSWKASSPVANESELPIQLSSAFEGQSSRAHTEVDTTPCEVRWQREREAVSKQIEEANASQVIIIDSDDGDEPNSVREDYGAVKEEAEDDDVDIWQQEANSSKSQPESSLQVANGLFQAEPTKPRRSKLPSTWRRGSQVVYSDEIEQSTIPEDIPQPKEDVIRAVQKGELAKQQMHHEGGSASISTPQEVNSTKPIDGRKTRTTRVRIDDQYRAVERPGWRSVKGRLQTPMKKTLKNVLSQHYEEENSQDLRVEDEETLDNGQDKTSSVAAAPNVSSTNLDAAAEAPISDEDTMMSHEENIEYEESIEIESGDESTYMSLAQTPPGSPPAHLVSLCQPRPAATSFSWLSSLTTYIPTIRTPASTPVPNASKFDPAKWNLDPYPPLYTHLPWEYNHWRVMRAYFEIQFANPGTYPFNPYSPSAQLLSLPIYARNNWGWVRYLSKSDCGLVDKYMEALRVKGVERRPGLWNTGDGARIDELEVAMRMFDMWQLEVHHSNCPIGEGNSIGNVPCTKIPLTPSKFKPPFKRKREVPIVP